MQNAEDPTAIKTLEAKFYDSYVNLPIQSIINLNFFCAYHTTTPTERFITTTASNLIAFPI